MTTLVVFVVISTMQLVQIAKLLVMNVLLAKVNAIIAFIYIVSKNGQSAKEMIHVVQCAVRNGSMIKKNDLTLDFLSCFCCFLTVMRNW
jgi:hypothetical protein